MAQMDGQIAVVIGGSSGIGAAISQEFAAAGARVVIADLEPPTAASAEPWTYIQLDITRDEEVGVTAAACLAEYGRVDILVNCAGTSSHAPITEMTLAEWDRVMAVNLRGVFSTIRHFAPIMIEQQSGRVINISSQLGQIGSPGVSHFCASKAGLIGFTKALARELVRHGVLVNAIAPGPVHTPALDREPTTWLDWKKAQLPLGRFGQPYEIAPTALLLAGPGGSFYVGQTLGPNGGDVML
jgi:Dehydrogenases with different specificities (related to short-chain alcohol dehydrogenases)